MTTVLLILPTSTYRAPEFLAAAARLSADVVTASEERQALAPTMGDRFLQLPVDDADAAADAIVAFSERRPLDAVLAVDDRGALAAALAAERLGLSANSPTAIAATTSKALLRSRLRADGVTQPAHVLIPGAGRRVRAAEAAREIGYPVVVKPISLSASRGVIRADHDGALGEAIDRIEAILESCGRADEELLVESYVAGAEVALEGLLVDGALHTLCLFDKPDPLEGPFFEETIYVTPSRLDEELQRSVRSLVADACSALGLITGPVHAEVRLREVGGGVEPVLIEVASRTIGGRCAKALQFATGQRLEELVIANALGQLREPPPLNAAAGVMMLPIPASGRFDGVVGREEATAVEHIAGLEIAVPRGGRIRALPEGDRYLGFLFSSAPDPAAAEAALREAHARLEIRIEPLAELAWQPR